MSYYTRLNSLNEGEQADAYMRRKEEEEEKAKKQKSERYYRRDSDMGRGYGENKDLRNLFMMMVIIVNQIIDAQILVIH